MTTKFYKLLTWFRKKKPEKIVKKESVQPSFTKTPNSNPIIEDTETSRAKKPVNKKVETQTLSSFPEVKSPLPSVRNYPEDANPDWLIGIDGEGDKVRTPPAGDASSITLTGAVTGNGSLENPVNTTLTAPINAQNNRIVNVSSPVNTSDAANKYYVDSTAGEESIILQGEVTGTGQTGSPLTTTLTKPINAGNNRITQVAAPTSATDAANKYYVDSTAGEESIILQGEVTGTGQTGSPLTTTLTKPINAGNNRITQVAAPTNATDAANKSYVDSHSGGVPDLLIAENVIGTGDASITSPITWIQSTIQTKSGALIQSINSETFRLQPGHSYELSALIPLKSNIPSFGTGVTWKWYQGSIPLGINGGAFIDTGNWPEEANFRPALAIIKVENTSIEVHVKYTSMLSAPRFRVGASGFCRILALN
jgi:hypothetical protein